MTATPVRRWTEVAIAGFQAVHSFGPLSVTIEQIVKPRFWRSRIVSAKASAIVALFWSVSSTRRRRYQFSTVVRQRPSHIRPCFRRPSAIKLTKELDEAAFVIDWGRAKARRSPAGLS
jgi:hypothetical protein